MKTNRIAAILLLVTLGYFGVHSFYQKKTLAGILYILAFVVFGWVSFVSAIASIFLLVEFYRLLTMSDESFAAIQQDTYASDEKSGLMAGVMGLVGGIFGLHFSYLGMLKATRNRFLLFFIPLVLLTISIVALLIQLFSGLPQNRELSGDEISKQISDNFNAGNLGAVVAFLAAGGVYFVVLYIISLVESYRYLQQKTIASK